MQLTAPAAVLQWSRRKEQTMATYSNQARRVLADCQDAWDRLELAAYDVEFRLLWVAAVALVRTVGHVLHKIDGGAEPALRQVAERHFKAWKAGDPSHRIFEGFIERERNNILKEYAPEISEGDIPVAVLGSRRRRSTWTKTCSGRWMRAPMQERTGATFSRTQSTGGRNASTKSTGKSQL